MNNKKNITILTTTKNSQDNIEVLINSLNNQIEKNFDWIIVDGGSSDMTIGLIDQKCKINYKIINSKDFSIYHAMNIGLAHIETEYYCVAGSDDVFELNFISNVNLYLKSGNYEIIFGSVKMGSDAVCKPEVGMGWLKGMHGVGSCHSVGTVINIKLHIKFGLYSKMYPVVADQYFIKKCIYGGAKILRVNECFGTYAMDGFSSTNKIQYQLDFFKMQLETEKDWLIQLLLFIARYMKLKLLNFLNK